MTILHVLFNVQDVEEQQWCYLSHNLGDKWFPTFPKGISAGKKKERDGSSISLIPRS